jgi:GYD domain
MRRAKLLAFYFTFGDYDFLSIAEAPSEEIMASALIAGGASGGVSHLRTSVAMTAKDAKKAFESAGTLSKSFKPPGGSTQRNARHDGAYAHATGPLCSPDVDRYSFIARDLHPLLLPGLPALRICCPQSHR